MQRKKIVKHLLIEEGGMKIPAKVYLEARRGIRFSLARRGAILRMPHSLSEDDQKNEQTRFEEWVKLKAKQKGDIEEHFSTRPYRSGDVLYVGDRRYLIQIEYSEQKTSSSRLVNGMISLKVSNQEPNKGKSIKHLLSRVIAKDFLPHISRRIEELNQKYFQKKVNSINLKYNLSNWGSCSKMGNINLSTCLLFAPHEVIDYVIIHELTHLIEMNHSPKFWQAVQKVMPDYKEKILWLKHNWSKCDFSISGV